VAQPASVTANSATVTARRDRLEAVVAGVIVVFLRQTGFIGFERHALKLID